MSNKATNLLLNWWIEHYTIRGYSEVEAKRLAKIKTTINPDRKK